jgi:uncharacterized membrane protein YbjE (DUF340 family)
MIKYILAALALGVAAGYAVNNFSNGFPNVLVTDYLLNAALYILLFVMGLTFAIDKEAVAKLKATGLKLLIVPVLVILGSILGGLVAGLIFQLDLFGSMAVTAGYGWYTLTGPLLTQMLGTTWGALGFAANFLRELLTIVTITLLVRLDKYAPIASGGATTMDTTLPVIVRYCGSETLITAFSSGFVLSMIAPFTVAAIASLLAHS